MKIYGRDTCSTSLNHLSFFLIWPLNVSGWPRTMPGNPTLMKVVNGELTRMTKVGVAGHVAYAAFTGMGKT